MDFGLTDDQRDIQRTARELLSERATPARVREHAEARTVDTELWRELSELGWPGIAVSEQYGGQGLGQIELSILCEELGRSLAPVPFLPSALAATVIEQAGVQEQCERWLPGLASGATIGALGTISDGVAELVIGGAQAQVLVLVQEETARAWRSPRGRRARAARGDRPDALGRACERARRRRGALGDVCVGLGRSLISDRLRARRRVRARAGDDRGLRKGPQAVRGVPVGAYQAVSHRCAQMLLDTEKARATAAAFAAWTADADEAGPFPSPRPPRWPRRPPPTPRAMSPRARSRPTAGSASPGRPTSTGCTRTRRSTPRCLAAQGATAPAWPRSWPRAPVFPAVS